MTEPTKPQSTTAPSSEVASNPLTPTTKLRPGLFPHHISLIRSALDSHLEKMSSHLSGLPKDLADHYKHEVKVIHDELHRVVSEATKK